MSEPTPPANPGGRLEPDRSGHVASFDGVRLWVERFGAPVAGRDPVLLLSEAEAPAGRWPDELVRELQPACGEVVRFDTRDVGRSDWVDTPYALDHLALDVVAVLDGVGAARAHLVGRSMGGMVAQLVAIRSPERVASLILLSSTPGGDTLPGPARWLVDRMAERLFGDGPVDDVERVEWIVEQQRWFAGDRYPFDEDRAYTDAASEVSSGWRGRPAHGDAVVGAEDRTADLARVTAPTAIVHGTVDPVYPPDHALALARAIPHAEVALIEGLGHELPPSFVPTFAGHVREFLSG